MLSWYYVHNRLPLSMCVAHPMWVAATLRGIHTHGHDAYLDHRHRESWAYEVPHLTPGHVGHRCAGQLPLAGPHYTCVLCFHEVHSRVCKASLHCQRVWFPWPSALVSGAVRRRSPIAMAYLPLLAPVPSLYVGILPSSGLCV